MKKQGSKAPKERVNIVYHSAANPADAVELPLKMLVMADLTGREDERSIEDRETVKILPHTFDEVLAAHDVGVSVEVRNRLEEGENASETFVANLAFKKLSDFTPGSIAKQVPELKKMLELRDALSMLKSPLGNRREFRKKIESILTDEGARAKLLAELGLSGQEKDNEKEVVE